MSEVVVADSACLIGLGRIRELEILRATFDRVLIPPEVQAELGETPTWLEVESAPAGVVARLTQERLDPGERGAIALALHRGCPVILDDLQARRIAAELGLAVIGTARVLIYAKRKAIIPAVAPLLDRLASVNFFLNDALRRAILLEAGEVS